MVIIHHRSDMMSLIHCRLQVHLLNSLKAQKITPFPSVKIKRKVGYLTEKINIYCKCRLLYVAERGFSSKVYPRSEDSMLRM